MPLELDPALHIEGCCCLACAEAASTADDPQASAGRGDSPKQVEQNAGGTSFPSTTDSSGGYQLGDYVLSGRQWDTTLLTFSFPDSSDDYEYTRSGTFQAFNPAQQSAALYTFDLIEQYTTVRFTQLTGSDDRNADIRLAEESSAPTAYAYYPSASGTGGDAWFNSSGYNTPVLGNYAFSIIVHEIGHTMGLKHGNETSFAGALPYEYDSHEYSVMTYRSYVGSPGTYYTDAPDSGPQTFMMADIAALQQMYGANYGTQSGNTIYAFDQTTGQMSINGVGQLDAGGDTIFRTVWDGNGVDTYDLSNFTTDLAIDLRPGEGTDLDVGGTRFRADLGPNTSDTFNNGYARKHVYNALLANGDTRSLVENANGGSGNDTFIGNQGDNRLDGGAGNDRFFDGAGSDTYVGGSGLDEVSFDGSFASYGFSIGASFLQVIGDFADFVSDTVETLTFSDRSWDYAALAGSLTSANPDAIEDAFAVLESDAAGLSAIGSVLANDTDADGLPLTVTAVNGQSAAVGSVITLTSGASLKLQADGSVSYGQNGAFAGLDAGEKATDSFTYTITNGKTTDTATVVVTIDGVADPNLGPAAADDAFRGDEGAAIGGNVLTNDIDPDGDPLQVVGVNGGAMTATLESGATVSMRSDGTFDYRQNGAFAGLESGQTATDSFTYTASDGQGGTSTATVIVTIGGVTHDSGLVDLLRDPGDLIGTAGDDSIRGDRGDQAIFGLDGDDSLEAKFGSDTLAGGAGNDRLRGDKQTTTTFYFGIEQDNGVVEVDRIDAFREGIDAINLGGGAVVSVESGRRETVLTLEGDGDKIVLSGVSSVGSIRFLNAPSTGGPDPLRGSEPEGVDWIDVRGHGDHEIFVPLVHTADGDDLVATTIDAPDGLLPDSIDLQTPYYLAG